jgi:hypothetical protein
MEKFLSFPITGSTTQLVSATGIILIEQVSSTSTTIAYKGGSTGVDILTITHGAVSDDDFRDFVQAQVAAALTTEWTKPVFAVNPPAAVSNIAVA